MIIVKTNIKTDHRVISTFIFTEKEVICILVKHINLSLGQANGYKTAIREEDCVFRATYSDDWKIESERVVKDGNNQ